MSGFVPKAAAPGRTDHIKKRAAAEFHAGDETSQRLESFADRRARQPMRSVFRFVAVSAITWIAVTLVPFGWFWTSTMLQKYPALKTGHPPEVAHG
jgi:hypothetical protein